MSKLVSTYAKSTGLKIGKMEIKEHFYPAPFDRYITIQTGSGQGAKNYDLFGEVLTLLKPSLEAAGITVIHLGGKDDPQVPHVYDLRGKTTIQQSAFILKRSLCHIGNDSWLVHLAGSLHRSIVALYGSTAVGPHGPYWSDVSKTILLESHRWGGKPTFVMQEAQKSINVIPPETVVNAVLGLLDLAPLTPVRKSLYMGSLFQHTIFELIPDSFPTMEFFPQAPMTARMDYLFNEDVLAGILGTGRKVNIVTRKPLNLNLINQFRKSILSYSHEMETSDETPLDYIRTIKTLVPKTTFFTKERDEVKLAALRFKLFDVASVEQVVDVTKEGVIDGAMTYLNAPKENRLDIEAQVCQASVKSNKFVLSQGALFLSHAHVIEKNPISSLSQNWGKVIDSPDFWRDFNHFYCYGETKNI